MITFGPDRTAAQQGEAAFAAAAQSVSPENWSGPTLLPGWNRGVLVAHLVVNARAFTRAVKGSAAGGDDAMFASRAARDQEIDDEASNDRDAVLADVSASSQELDAAWDGLSEEAWGGRFTNGRGDSVPLAGTVWGRAREVWVHLVDLNTGSTFEDVPPKVNESVMREVWRSWEAAGTSDGLAVSTQTADGKPLALGSTERPGTVLVSGSLPDVVGWATGRYAGGPTATVSGTPAPLPEAPHWL